MLLIIANKSFIDGFILNAHIQLMSTKKRKHEVSMRNVFPGLAKKGFRHIRKGLQKIRKKKFNMDLY